MNMFVLMVLPFWLGVRNKSRFQIGVSLLTVFLGVAWILFAMSTIPRPDRSFGMVQIALYYLMHPVETIKAFFHTFTDIGLLKFYRDSFAGQLGWLDYCVSKGVIYLTHVLVWGALIYGCIRSKFLTTWRSEGGFLFIVAIGSALSTFFFYLFSGPRSHVQGLSRAFKVVTLLLRLCSLVLQLNIPGLFLGHTRREMCV